MDRVDFQTGMVKKTGSLVSSQLNYWMVQAAIACGAMLLIAWFAYSSSKNEQSSTPPGYAYLADWFQDRGSNIAVLAERSVGITETEITKAGGVNVVREVDMTQYEVGIEGHPLRLAYMVDLHEEPSINLCSIDFEVFLPNDRSLHFCSQAFATTKQESVRNAMDRFCSRALSAIYSGYVDKSFRPQSSHSIKIDGQPHQVIFGETDPGLEQAYEARLRPQIVSVIEELELEIEQLPVAVMLSFAAIDEDDFPERGRMDISQSSGANGFPMDTFVERVNELDWPKGTSGHPAQQYILIK